jgi:aspartate-semialdehyde dehydrogenase
MLLRTRSDLAVMALAAALGADTCTTTSVVPGVYTGDPCTAADARRGIIANPDCSTAAATQGLKSLHDEAGRVRMIPTTLAVSGGGVAGVEERTWQALHAGDRATGLVHHGSATAFTRPVAYNTAPMIGSLVDDGPSGADEEQKLHHESRNILGMPALDVSGTCVRAPVRSGQSLPVRAEIASPMTAGRATALFSTAPGIEVVDMPRRCRRPARTRPSWVGSARA